MAPTNWILSIDFGTSNSAAAHSGATSGGIETLSLTHTSHLMASSVFVEAADRIAVGEAAYDMAQRNPAGFVSSPKRLISANPAVTVNGMNLPTYALVAAVMRTVLQRGAAAHAGQPPSQVVLTHPEAWSHQQIQVLVDAARYAGVRPEQITTISEPRAAAAHYSRSHSMEPGARIAVFDFGGGTLDIAVLTVSNENAFEVVAARGNNNLGGKNLDTLLQRWVEQRLEDRDPTIVNYLRREASVDVIQGMQESIRRAKELLSEAPSATITVSTPGGRQQLQITRDEFEELIAGAIDQAMQLTKATLLDANINHPQQLTALYLTGGSSRIPMIQQRLHELGPVATLDDPKTVVAQGALVTALAESTPSGPQRQAYRPEAAELIPATWQGQGRPGPTQQSPTPGPTANTGPTGQIPTRAYDPGREQATATPKKRRTGLLVGGVLAVVAVIGVVIGAIALSGGDSGGSDDAAAGGGGAKPPAAQANPADGSSVATDEKTVLATLPAPLQDGISGCRKTGFHGEALKLSCRFKSDSSLSEASSKTAGNGAFDMSMEVYVDPSAAANTIVDLRNGLRSQGKGTLVENSGRTAAGEITNALGGKDYDIDYANTANGLNIRVVGVASTSAGKTFLTRSGLLS